jgi:CrcB protein
MVVITELAYGHRLLRPFLGVGVLGGYTTFSTATVEVLSLIGAGRPGTAAGYVVATPMLSVLGCGLGVVTTRLVAGRSPRRPEAAR